MQENWHHETCDETALQEIEMPKTEYHEPIIALTNLPNKESMTISEFHLQTCKSLISISSDCSQI